MKKNKLISFFTILIVGLMFFEIKDVKAIMYNGTGTPSGGSGVGGCSNSSVYCMYGNNDHLTIKVSVYYIDNGEFDYDKPLYSEYWTNSKSNFVYTHYKGQGIKYKGVLKNVGDNSYDVASSKLNDYFSEGNYKKNKNWLKKAKVDKTKESQAANKKNAATKGYRIILEPVFSFEKGGKYYLLTAKEILKEWNNNNFSWSKTSTESKAKERFNTMAKSFFTDFKDVGISGIGNKDKCWTSKNSKGETLNAGTALSTSIENTKKQKNGCGYNIIDISWFIPAPDPPPLSCTDMDGTVHTTDYETCVNTLEEDGENSETAEALCTQTICPRLVCPTNAAIDVTSHYQAVKGTSYKIGETTYTYTNDQAKAMAYIAGGCYGASCGVYDCFGRMAEIKTASAAEMQSVVQNNSANPLGALINYINSYQSVCSAASCCLFETIATSQNSGKCVNELQNVYSGSTVIINGKAINYCEADVLEYGKKIGSVGNCDIFCKQTATFKLPGNVKGTIKPGTSFEWPSRPEDPTNSYKLEIKTNIMCYAVSRVELGGACGGSLSFETLKNAYNDNIILTYTDKKYGIGKNIVLEKNRTVESCTNCGQNLSDARHSTNMNIPYDYSNGKIIYVSANFTTRYSLPKTTYNFIDRNGIYFNSSNTSGAVLPLLDRGKGTLPVSIDAKGNYKLNLSMNVGINGLKKLSNEIYTCKYTVNDGDNSCVCPSGTIQAGEKIDQYLLCSGKDSANTCDLGQLELCNKTDTELEEYLNDECVCVYKKKTVDLSDCMEKTDYEVCKNKYSGQINKCVEKKKKTTEYKRIKEQYDKCLEDIKKKDETCDYEKLSSEIEELELTRKSNESKMEEKRKALQENINSYYDSIFNNKREETRQFAIQIEILNRDINKLELDMIEIEEQIQEKEESINKCIRKVPGCRGKINEYESTNMENQEDCSKKETKECTTSNSFEYCYNLKCNSVCNNDDCIWTKKEYYVNGNPKPMYKWMKKCLSEDSIEINNEDDETNDQNEEEDRNNNDRNNNRDDDRNNHNRNDDERDENNETNEEEDLESRYTEICDLKFTCPGCEGTSPGSCDMNPTDCVSKKLGRTDIQRGLELGEITKEQLQNALMVCERTVCPIGKKIVYRVIDLSDPFPGMSAKTTGNVQNINNNISGRYPGYNWNNEFWVKNKIRNARRDNVAVEGDDLYNQKPIYVIELTPTDIKNIRENNKDKSYSEWLEGTVCSGNNSSDSNRKCMSKFLRNTSNLSNGLSGLCGSISDANSLKTCYEQNTTSSSSITWES